MKIRPTLGVIYITERRIEIEVDKDVEEFKEMIKALGGRVTWAKEDMKIGIVDGVRVVFKSLPTTLETLDEYCLERR